MTTLSESTMARSRCTTVVSRLSWGSYSTSATSVGSAGRGDPQSRPSPTWGGLTIWGPSARGLAASAESGLPPGAGRARVVSGAPAFGTGRPKPPLGPTPRRVPPNGGSSGGCGREGGMIVINPCGRSIRHEPLNARTMIATCAPALTTQVSRRNSRVGLRISNSGEHLSQPLGRLDQPRCVDRERDAEKPLPARPEPAPAERHHSHLRERAARERGGGDALGERHPHVHRRLGRLGLEPLGAERGQHRIAPLPKARDVALRQLLRLRQHRRPCGLDREERTPVHVVLHAPQRRDELRPPRGPRSEEHTSELQSPCNLVCRLLLEKKKKKKQTQQKTTSQASYINSLI